MSVDLRARGIRAIVLDIEGTTTPVSFVHDVLFPYARGALRSYLQQAIDAPRLREPLSQLHDEWMRDASRSGAPPAWPDAAIADRDRRVEAIARYAEWLMDRDRKASGLKALQGHIWAGGYEDGRLRGDVYADVPAAFDRWKAAGLRLAIFSSGSVLAQQLLFRSTAFGDLTRSIDAFFDTSIGPKISADSYRRIADALGLPAASVLFISDSVAELDAARTAGLATLLCIRPDQGVSPAESPSAETIHDFNELS